MPKRNAFVLICRSYRTVEKAISILRSAHFNVRRVSIIGKDHFHLSDDTTASARESNEFLLDVMAFWYRIWRLLPGDEFFKIDGIGSIIVAGPMSKPMREAITNPSFFHACSPLRAGMQAFGISKENLARYEAALQSDHFLVIALGDSIEINEAENMLKTCANLKVTKTRHADPEEQSLTGNSSSNTRRGTGERFHRDVNPRKNRIPDNTKNQSL